MTGGAALAAVETALCSPPSGPPLAAHVVPGDRVAVAVAGAVPQVAAVIAAVRLQIVRAGVAEDDICILRAPPLEEGAPVAEPVPGEHAFDPGDEAGAAYIAADADGQPLHIARALVDADVVVTVGGWSWDAALGGESLDDGLWPLFARLSARQAAVRLLARSGRKARDRLRAMADEVGWQLGAIASLRVVPGGGGSLRGAVFGIPQAAGRRARRLAAGWRPHVAGTARLAIASLANPTGGMAVLVRAVAAAARTTHPEGTICIAGRMSEPPGIVLTRWRQGTALGPLVREALASGDQTLIRDAMQTRFLARALGDRRLVILSDLEGAVIEELEFGHATAPEVVERLAHRADSLVVIHEAERMFPRLGGPGGS